MDESVVKHLEQQQVGTLKLSEAIRKGLTVIKEDPGAWQFCALGAAFAGVHGRQMTNEEGWSFVLGKGKAAHKIADALGFQRDACQDVHLRHCAGNSASKIAKWLERKGL